MTTFTPNFTLDKYEGADKPDLTDQYNAAMEKIDTALQAALEARAELQNSIGTLNINLTATNTALNAVKTEVDKNTPLVEEHVNYFAALGVTDEDSANALHTEIDNAYQGTVSNTAKLSTHEQEINQLNQSAVIAGFDLNFIETTVEGLNLSLGFGVSPNANTIKFLGRLVNNLDAPVNVPLVPIPGRTNAYGYKISQYHIDTGGKAYVFDWVGVLYNFKSRDFMGRSAAWSLGSDGYVYILSSSSASYEIGAGDTHMWFQLPLMLSEPWEIVTVE